MTARKNKSSDKSYVMLLLAFVAVFAIGCGLFYASTKSHKDVMDGGAGDDKSVSLLSESVEAQRLIDNILLSKDNWQLSEKEHGVKQIQVDGSDNKIEINQRELAVGIPPTTSLEGAGEWLREKAERAGLVFISGEKGEYKSYDGFTAKIGIKVKAGAGSKNILTDTVTFFHNRNLQKEDKDVKHVGEKKEQSAARTYKGKLAVIVDDCGADMSTVRKMLNTGLPFSYAILPYKDFSSDVLSLVTAKGNTAMLHLPMEPLDSSAISEGGNTILTSMSDSKQRDILRRALQSLPGVAGVNNHQGSKATSDAKTMKNILGELKARGIFFVDSRTSSASVARDTARNMGVPTARNDIFLDNSTDIEEIRQQIYKAMAEAEKNGSAVAICHARTNTAVCWERYVEEFKETGITFVPVTELLY